MANNKQDKILNVPNKREQRQTCLNVAERQALRPKGSVPNKREQRNVPALRFPEFKGQWENCRIKDFGKVVTGNTPPTANKENYENGTKLWVSPSDLGDKKYIDNTKIKLSIKGYTQTRILPKDSILVTCIGTIGKMGMAQTELATNQQINSIIVNHDFDKDFVYYSLMSRFPKYLSFIAIQVVPILSKSSFEKLENNYPSIKEQRKIGKFLDLIDARIATQRKIIEKLESLIKGLNNTLYKQYGNGIKTSFAELGYSYSGLTGKTANDFGTGKPFITYLNVYSNNIIDENAYQYVRINNGEQQNVVKYGDVLFTLSSETPEEVGIGSVYLGETDVYLNSFCFGIHIENKQLAYSPYLSYFVSSTPFRKFIYPFAQGSTRFNLYKADFERAAIMLPSLDKQKRIYAVLSRITMKIEIEKSTLKQYVVQKQYLLQRMFI